MFVLVDQFQRHLLLPQDCEGGHAWKDADAIGRRRRTEVGLQKAEAVQRVEGRAGQKCRGIDQAVQRGRGRSRVEAEKHRGCLEARLRESSGKVASCPQARVLCTALVLYFSTLKWVLQIECFLILKRSTTCLKQSTKGSKSRILPTSLSSSG